MYHIKDDRRSIRSSEMLYDGLAILIRKKPFNTITVSELVEVAGMGRTTFYRNFDDIEDILRLRCDQVCRGLIGYIVAHLNEHTLDSHAKLLTPLLRYFDQHSEIIELLMHAKRIDMIYEAFRQMIEPFKTQFLSLQPVDDAYLEYTITIRISIVTSILTHWIANGKQTAPDELAEKLSRMITNLVTLDQLL